MMANTWESVQIPTQISNNWTVGFGNLKLCQVAGLYNVTYTATLGGRGVLPPMPATRTPLRLVRGGLYEVVASRCYTVWASTDSSASVMTVTRSILQSFAGGDSLEMQMASNGVSDIPTVQNSSLFEPPGVSFTLTMTLVPSV